MLRKQETALKNNIKWGIRTALKSASILAGLGCMAVAQASAADVTYERLLKPEPQNWLMHHSDFGAQRFSALDQINKTNAKNLRLAFTVPLGGKAGNEFVAATPLVDGGFMYISDVWGVVYKI